IIRTLPGIFIRNHRRGQSVPRKPHRDDWKCQRLQEFRRSECGYVPLRYQQSTPESSLTKCRVPGHIRPAWNAMAESGSVRDTCHRHSWKSWPWDIEIADDLAIRCSSVSYIPFPGNPERGVPDGSIQRVE